MKCEKCNHENSEYSIICEKCGAPLNIEENKFLQEKYHNKGRHIDIEEIEKTQNSMDFNTTRKKVFKIIVAFLILLFILLIYGIVNYLVDKESKEMLDSYSYYMKNSSLVLFYFGTNEELDEMCSEYSTSYGFDYLNIKANKITQKNKKKMREELNVYNIMSTLVIVQSGVPIATLSNPQSEEDILSFLQGNELVPMYLGDTEVSLTAFKNALASENPALIYFPTSFSENVEDNSEVLQSIAEQYAIDYYEIQGYFLSKKQLLRLMSQLGFSEIQDDLLIYVMNGKIEKIITDTDKNSDSYFQLLSSYDIIDVSSADYLINISTTQFQEFLEDEKEKHVVLIGSNNCAYCDRVKPILGQIASQYQVAIYYLNVNTSSADWNTISNAIVEMGINTGLTSTPFMLVVEKHTVLDYIVGLATKDFYVESLTEIGVIR